MKSYTVPKSGNIVVKQASERVRSISVTGRARRLVDKLTRADKELLSRHGYTIGPQLGNGSYGDVHEATSKLGRAAVKLQDISNLSPSKRRFLAQELLIMQKVAHPNVMRLRDVVNCSSTILLIFMERGKGGDLFSLLQDKFPRPLPEDQAKDYYRQIAAGLNHLHSQGFIHRDIKPQNVVFMDTDKTHLKLIDFGMSAIAHSHETLFTGTGCGTGFYMAPEIVSIFAFAGRPAIKVNGKVVNFSRYDPLKTDVWSLGVMLYEMLNATLPFLLRGRDYDAFLLEQAHPKLPFENLRLSIEAREFISMHLKFVPGDRVNMAYMLEHRWLKPGGRFAGSTARFK